MTKQEVTILDMKYAAKRFGDMNETELELCSIKILLVVHTITGWSLPVDELMEILSNQFKLKLKEGYSTMNEQEFEYAFRNKSSEIKDWGKSLNFSLIDEVIAPYLEQRFELSRFEEQKKNTLLIENKEPDEAIETIDMIEDWRKKEDLNMLLIPLFFYDFLVETEMIKITNKEKWESWAKAKESVKSELLSAIPECKTNNAINEWRSFEECENSKHWDNVMFGRISNRAKRMIVFDYLTKK